MRKNSKLPIWLTMKTCFAYIKKVPLRNRRVILAKFQLWHVMKGKSEKMVVLYLRSRIPWILPYYKSCKLKNRGVTIFCPCFLSTHQGDHPQIYVTFSRHPNVHLDVFVFTRRAFFIKWEPWMYRCIITFLTDYTFKKTIWIIGRKY